MFGWEWKSGMMKNMSLCKFTHTLLLKNDAQLKKTTNKKNKKNTITQITSKQKIKIKIKIKKKRNVQEKKK